MTEDNPYAAPQADLEQYRETELLAGELPFFGEWGVFQQGAADAGQALTYAVALVLITIAGGVSIGLLFVDALVLLLGIAVLLAAQRICWKFYAGLARMAAESRLFLRPLLLTAKSAFAVGWGCYLLKIAVLLMFSPMGRTLFACCDLLDSLAGAVMALALGLTGLRLSWELCQSGLRRAAWLTMIFLGGSHLLFLLLDVTLYVERFAAQPGLSNWWGDSILLLIWVPIVWFLIGFFALLGLLNQLGRLPIRRASSLPPLAESILDEETIERRRRMAEGA